jgi:hypothetical protein
LACKGSKSKVILNKFNNITIFKNIKAKPRQYLFENYFELNKKYIKIVKEMQNLVGLSFVI